MLEEAAGVAGQSTATATGTARAAPRAIPGVGVLYLVFFASGFAALLYQLVWQRSLFVIFGINIESVTVVVTAFMVGLGFGSLAGGAVSRIPTLPPLLAFGVIELGIGAFGLVSLPLFDWIGDRVLHLGSLATAAIAFAVVLLPTLLMGATLPVLTAYLVLRSRNVGRSLGRLYYANTIGSAMASFAAVVVLMKTLGQHGVVTVAVALNLIVGGSAVMLHLRSRRQAS